MKKLIELYIGESIAEFHQREMANLVLWIKTSAMEFITLAYVIFVIYIGYKTFFNAKQENYLQLYVSTTIYVVLRLFWKIQFRV